MGIVNIFSGKRVDIFAGILYNSANFIGQFVTILSVNKTRERGGGIALIFHGMGAFCAHFLLEETPMNMKKHTARLTQAAMIAAAYAALSFAQNLIFPNSATMMVQFRVAESLCVLAFFTPAAIPGLTIGCALFNLTAAGTLPLDILIGSAATALATLCMWLLRKKPFFGLWMPAIFNGLLVGWELSFYVGGGFWLNAGCVALGEIVVLLTLGSLLYAVLRRHKAHLPFA